MIKMVGYTVFLPGSYWVSTGGGGIFEYFRELATIFAYFCNILVISPHYSGRVDYRISAHANIPT